MAIEFDVRRNRDWTWVIQLIVNKVEVIASLDTQTGNYTVYSSRSIAEHEAILSKMKELQNEIQS